MMWSLLAACLPASPEGTSTPPGSAIGTLPDPTECRSLSPTPVVDLSTFDPDEVRATPPCPDSLQPLVLERSCWRDQVDEAGYGIELPIHRRTYYHPVHGQPVRVEVDGHYDEHWGSHAADGVVDEIDVNVWSEDGSQILARLEYAPDGTLEDGWCQTYTDGPVPNMVERWELLREGPLAGDVWWPDVRRAYQGPVVVESCVGEGCYLQSFTEVDHRERRLETRIYRYGKRSGWSVYQWTELAHGGARWVQCPIEVDEGRQLYRERGELDARGRMVARTSAMGPDFEYTTLVRYRYDVLDRVVEEFKYRDGDLVESTRYTYHANDTVRTEVSSAALLRRDGQRGTQITEIERDAAGRTLRWGRRDLDAHDVVTAQFEAIRFHDARGIPTGGLSRVDEDGDGVWEEETAYELPPVVCDET